VTNGHAGLAGIPRPNAFGFAIDNPFKYVVLTFTVAAVTYAICHRLTNSAFGRRLRAVRDDERSAQIRSFLRFFALWPAECTTSGS